MHPHFSDNQADVRSVNVFHRVKMPFIDYFGFRTMKGMITSSSEMPPCWKVFL